MTARHGSVAGVESGGGEEGGNNNNNNKCLGGRAGKGKGGRGRGEAPEGKSLDVDARRSCGCIFMYEAVRRAAEVERV